MAQPTPEELGLIPFGASELSDKAYLFLIAYYVQQLQTQGIVGTEDVNLTKLSGQTVSVNNGSADNGTQRVAVSTNGFNGTSTVTRPGNTTTYAANDVVGGALTIANVGRDSTDIVITDVKMTQNISAVPSGQTSFRLYLYNVTPPSAIADNSPFTYGSGDRASFLGYIDLGSPALIGTGTGSPYVQVSGVNLSVRMPAGTSLFAYLVTAGALVPAAGSETYTITVKSISI